MGNDLRVTQSFHAPVTNVAGRDILQTNITSIHILQALHKAVEASPHIPEANKSGLLRKLRVLIEEPYIAGLATSALYEAMKSVLTHGQ